MWTRIARNTVSTLAVAAAILSANPARADHDRDRDEGRDRWRGGPSPVAVVVTRSAPQPLPAWYVPARPAPPVAAVPPWRLAHWRMERRQELRHEYRELEHARAEFYARWDGRPWARDRFESWYAAHRAELDARAAELERWRR